MSCMFLNSPYVCLPISMVDRDRNEEASSKYWTDLFDYSARYMLLLECRTQIEDRFDRSGLEPSVP